MEAQEQPIIEEAPKRSNTHFTRIQSFLLIFSTLILCLGGGYYISDTFFWKNDSERKMLNEQLAYYKSLVDAEPNNPEHRVNLGYTYHLNGKNEDAIKQMKIAMDLEKDYFGAHFNLGLVYIAEGRFNDALIESKRTVEISPRDYRSHLLTGMVYRELDMYEDASQSLAEALALVPTNTDIINEIARVAEDQGKTDEAEKLFKEALTFDPLYKPASEGLDRLAAKPDTTE
jgi:tetratricopeptide (TPR) repeat protein